MKMVPDRNMIDSVATSSICDDARMVTFYVRRALWRLYLFFADIVPIPNSGFVLRWYGLSTGWVVDYPYRNAPSKRDKQVCMEYLDRMMKE